MVRVYVGGLAQDVTEKELKEFFGRRLPIKKVEINTKHARVFSNLRNVTVFAFLELDCEEAQLEKILAYNKCLWNGSYLRIQPARKPPYVYISREPVEEDKRQVDVSQQGCSGAQEQHVCPTDTLDYDSTLQQTNLKKRRVRILNTLRPKACF